MTAKVSNEVATGLTVVSCCINAIACIIAISWIGDYAIPWWRHQMKAFSASLALCEGIPPFTSGIPSHMPVTRSFDVFFDLRLNKRLNKQSRRRWAETPSRSSWCDCHAITHWGPDKMAAIFVNEIFEFRRKIHRTINHHWISIDWHRTDDKPLPLMIQSTDAYMRHRASMWYTRYFSSVSRELIMCILWV